jgi:large subunit ribosomal protein L35
MPKMKTHKGIKKRFKVSATGKVSHKRCGSSHLNSHKSGKKIRRLRKKSILKVSADAKRLRRAVRTRERVTTRLEIVDGENVTPTEAAAPQA